MLFVFLNNNAEQAVPVGGSANLGNVVRKYCKCINCKTTFANNGNSLALQQEGVYKVEVNINFSGDAAGDVTFQLANNGVLIPGAIATETITTADTEFRNVTLTAYVLVDSSCVLNTVSTFINNISVVNSGVTAGGAAVAGVDATIYRISTSAQKVV